MDRDRRWERTQAAYDLLVHGRAEHQSPDGPSAARAAYERGETDEFITADYGRRRRAESRASDSVLCFNFRPGPDARDRARARRARLRRRHRGAPGMARPRRAAHRSGALATMTEYQKGCPYPVAFTAAHPATTLGGGDRRRRRAPAARGRDREVRARHVLLQRRPRATVRRRATRTRPVPARRPDLRPQAAR